jgi:hypothetical protein
MQGGPGMVTAYDNNVFICAASPKQLQWSVRQYKGGKETSLATANKSFARLAPAEQRGKDALTVWADPAALYQGWRETAGARMGTNAAVAAAMFDVPSMQGALARVMLDEKNPSVEATLVYREGHQAVGYDLVRTPALTREGFEAVPPGAVGVLSFALGEAQAGGAAQAGAALKRLTGLDIGRELFANIEQVNLFLMPMTDAMAKMPLARQTAPCVPAVGLALTSKDPQRTRQLLDELLSVPQTMIAAAGGRGAPVAPGPARRPGEYPLPMVAGGVTLYLGQAGHSTVLALDPSVLEAALAAAKASPEERAKGPLGADLARVPAGACKLALLNAGGAVRTYASSRRATISPRALTQPSVQASFDQMDRLAELLSKTALMANSVETPNRVTVRLSASNLPPLADLFSLMGQ